MPAALYGKKEEKKKRLSICLYLNTLSNIVLYANLTLTLRHANVLPTRRAAGSIRLPAARNLTSEWFLS